MKSWRGLAVIALTAAGLLANIQGPMAEQAQLIRWSTDISWYK